MYLFVVGGKHSFLPHQCESKYSILCLPVMLCFFIARLAPCVPQPGATYPLVGPPFLIPSKSYFFEPAFCAPGTGRKLAPNRILRLVRPFLETPYGFLFFPGYLALCCLVRGMIIYRGQCSCLADSRLAPFGRGVILRALEVKLCLPPPAGPR